jgi:hypothetical protein
MAEKRRFAADLRSATQPKRARQCMPGRKQAEHAEVTEVLHLPVPDFPRPPPRAMLSNRRYPPALVTLTLRKRHGSQRNQQADAVAHRI